MSRPSSTRRILLLHHDPAEIQTISQALNKAGFSTVEADAARMALHELVHDPPCLMLAAEGAGGRSVDTLVE
jgi:DNA-binding response OmpR family regulator